MEPVSRSDSPEDAELIDRADENVDNHTNAAVNMDVVDTACDSDDLDYDSGVKDASDSDSDIEERQVGRLINKCL